MSGSSPNLALAAECERQRRIAEWQMASMGMVVGPAPRPAGTNLLGASYDDAGALLPQGGVPEMYSGSLSAAAGTQGPALGGQMSMACRSLLQQYNIPIGCGTGLMDEQNRQATSQQQAQNMPDIRQAVTQAMGSLAVLLERSRCVLGQSLIGIGAFIDPVADPVVVAASKPVNPALARAMGCGSRQAIGFMVR